MNARREGLKNPHTRLPEVELVPLTGGAARRLQPRSRASALLVLIHAADCTECRDYLGTLAKHDAELTGWDGRVTVIVADGRTDESDLADAVDLPFTALMDPEGRVGSGLSLEAPGVVVADQWGEVHALLEAGPEHRFPTPEEVVDWARYLAIQCPECQGEAL